MFIFMTLLAATVTDYLVLNQLIVLTFVCA